jgi:hypothetical protein
MSKFTLARVLFACVGSLLLLAGCSPDDDPKSAFPHKLQTQVRLRDGPAKEKTRIVHYAEDKETPLWAEVVLTNDHTRKVYYENHVMVRSEEFYKPEDGGGLYLKRLYMPDGRNLKAEEQRLPDGTVTMQGDRNPDGSYNRSFYTDKKLVRHLLLNQNGDTLGEENYYASGAMKQKTTRNGDILTVDSFDEAGYPTLSESSDRYGYNKSKTLYFSGSKQVRIKSELASGRSNVVIYRPDGSVEQDWVRASTQTIVIQHWDARGNVVWRQNLLLYRYRLGAPAKITDWRVFSTEDVNAKGAVIRRVLYDKDGAPRVVFYPTENSSEDIFEGVIKDLRADGTVERVRYHERDGKEVVKEQHTAAENIRDPIDPAFAKMPTEDYSFAPMQMGIFGGRGGY